MTDPTQFESASSRDDGSLGGEPTLAAPISSVSSRTIDFTVHDGHVGPIPTPEVPGYAIESELGRGGMGVVYKARQLPLNRQVALKMILAGGHASPGDRSRFLGEAEAAARLSHPGIVSVYAFGTTPDGHPFFAQEYLSGGSLSKKLNNAPQPWREAAEVIATVADAVQHAHEQGVVHRDLKPGNVLLTTDGRPKVTDFGLAKTSESGVTVTGAMMGTPSYISPEQAQNARSATALSDVYSLGAIFYEALTGRPPFRGADALATLRQVQEQEPVPIRRLVPTVPRDAETICLKCLEKSPHKRYPSAAALALDLRRALEGESIHARPSSAVERTVKWARRRPALAGLLAVSVMALIGLVGLSWFFTGRLQSEVAATRNALKEVQEQKQIADAQTQIAEDQSTKLRSELSFSNFMLARAAVDQNRCEIALDHLRQVAPEHRGWEWGLLKQQISSQLTIYCPSRATTVFTHPDGRQIISGHFDGTIRITDLLDNREIRVLRGHSGTVRALAMSLDGRRLISGSSDNSVRAWDVKSGHELAIVRAGQDFKAEPVGLPWVNVVAIDSTGRWAAFAASGHQVQIWDLETKALKPLGDGETDVCESLAFFPDHHRLAVVSTDLHQLRIWDYQKNELIREIPGGQITLVTSTAVSPNGEFIATGSTDSTVRVWDVARCELQALCKGHTGSVNSLAFSPDGRYIASGSADRTIRVFKSTNGESIHLIRGHTGNVGCVAFTRDGRHVVSCSDDSTIRCWDVEPGGPLISIPVHKDWIGGMVVTPDGRRVVTGSGDQTVRVTELESGQLIHLLEGHTGAVYSVAVSSDGRWIASGGGDRTVRVWDAVTGAAKHVFQGHTRSVSSVAIDRSNRRVVSCSSDGTIRQWDIETGQTKIIGPPGLRSLSAVAYQPGSDQLAYCDAGGVSAISDGEVRFLDGPPSGRFGVSTINSITYSGDGRWIAGAGLDRTVSLRAAKEGAEQVSLVGHDEAVLTVAFTPDGKRIASGGRDCTVRIWDVAARRELLTHRAHPRPVTALHFLNDGSRLVTASEDGIVRVWDILPERPHHFVSSRDRFIDQAGFSADGRLLAVVTGGRGIRVINPKTGEIIRELNVPGMFFTKMTLSHDGRQLAAGALGGQVRLWNLDDRSAPKQLSGLKGSIDFIAFSPDGSRVYTWETKVNIQKFRTEQEVFSWDTTTGQQVPDDPPKNVPAEVTTRFGDLVAWIDRYTVHIIDTKLTARELEFRKLALRPDPFFHERQSAAAENDHDWFAAAFHLDRWLAAQPANREANRRRGLVALENGDWERAMWHFDVATSRMPD